MEGVRQGRVSAPEMRLEPARAQATGAASGALRTRAIRTRRSFKQGSPLGAAQRREAGLGGGCCRGAEARGPAPREPHPCSQVGGHFCGAASPCLECHHVCVQVVPARLRSQEAGVFQGRASTEDADSSLLTAQALAGGTISLKYNLWSSRSSFHRVLDAWP